MSKLVYSNNNTDTTLVVIFFCFFLLLTFWNVGISMNFVRNIFDKFKSLFCIKPKIQKLSPEQISFKYKKLSDFLTGRNKFYSLSYSLSLFLSNLTPVNLLGVPLTTYFQGVQYFSSILSFPIAIMVTNYIFVPVFYGLQIKTANQYIDKRFNFTVKIICLCLIVATSLIKTGIWLNTPHLILSSFTQISEQTCLFLTVIIVIIYTSIGGMELMQKMEKIQLFIMLFSLVSIVTKGIARVGGIEKIIEENQNNKRLSLNFNLTPFTNRHSFWSVLSTNTFMWSVTYSIQQTSLNRYLNSGSINIVKRILFMQIPLMMLFYFLICFIGLLLYTFYSKCDPLITKRIDHLETLVGLFAYDMTHNSNGILGLFIIALYSITLSSSSSSLNGLSTIIFEDILKFYDLEIDSYLFVRISMFIFGIVIVITMLCVKLFTQSFKLRTMLSNTLIGPVFATFILGLHFRRINSKCALFTLIIGLSFGLFIFFIHFKDTTKFPSLGTNYQDCNEFFCFSRPEYCNSSDIDKLKLPFYSYPFSLDYSLLKYLSYMYDGWLITLFTILTGLILSLFINKPDKNSQEIEECLAMYVRNFPKQSTIPEYPTEYVLDNEEDNQQNLKNNLINSLIDINYLKRQIDELLKND